MRIRNQSIPFSLGSQPLYAHLSSLPSCQLVQLTHLFAYNLLVSLKETPPIPQGETTDLLTNILPTILAPHRLLNNIITTRPPIRLGHHKKRHTNPQQIKRLIQKLPVRHHHGAIVKRLLQRIVRAHGGVIGAVPKNGKFFIEVFV